MAGQFYFDLERSEHIVRDLVGTQVDTREQAVIAALAVLNEMRCQSRARDFDHGWRLVIRDASNNIVADLEV